MPFILSYPVRPSAPTSYLEMAAAACSGSIEYSRRRLAAPHILLHTPERWLPISSEDDLMIAQLLEVFEELLGPTRMRKNSSSGRHGRTHHMCATIPSHEYSPRLPRPRPPRRHNRIRLLAHAPPWPSTFLLYRSRSRPDMHTGHHDLHRMWGGGFVTVHFAL